MEHRSAVTDLHFNPQEILVIMTCSDESGKRGGGSMQVWKPVDLLLYDKQSEKSHFIDDLSSLLCPVCFYKIVPTVVEVGASGPAYSSRLRNSTNEQVKGIGMRFNGC